MKIAVAEVLCYIFSQVSIIEGMSDPPANDHCRGIAVLR